MLYSTTIQLDKEYIVKLGTAQALKIEERGIDLLLGAQGVNEIIEILTIALEQNEGLFIRANGEKMSFEESKEKVIYLLDNSEIPLSKTVETDKDGNIIDPKDDIICVIDIINKARDLGIFKLKNIKDKKGKNSMTQTVKKKK